MTAAVGTETTHHRICTQLHPEAVDMIGKAYEVADEYRNPVIIAVDGMIGQMMETCRIAGRSGLYKGRGYSEEKPRHWWATRIREIATS